MTLVFYIWPASVKLETSMMETTQKPRDTSGQESSHWNVHHVPAFCFVIDRSWILKMSGSDKYFTELTRKLINHLDCNMFS